MRFQVPQFIEVEDKIFGPFTIKQFVYLAGGAGACFIVYSFLPFILAVILIVPIAIFAAALAFYKINNKPFIFTLEAAFKYLVNARLYIWRKGAPRVTKAEKDEPMEYATLQVPRLSESKLKELTWSLHVKQSENPVTMSDGTTR